MITSFDFGNAKLIEPIAVFVMLNELLPAIAPGGEEFPLSLTGFMIIMPMSDELIEYISACLVDQRQLWVVIQQWFNTAGRIDHERAGHLAVCDIRGGRIARLAVGRRAAGFARICRASQEEGQVAEHGVECVDHCVGIVGRCKSSVLCRNIVQCQTSVRLQVKVSSDDVVAERDSILSRFYDMHNAVDRKISVSRGKRNAAGGTTRNDNCVCRADSGNKTVPNDRGICHGKRNARSRVHVETSGSRGVEQADTKQPVDRNDRVFVADVCTGLFDAILNGECSGSVGIIHREIGSTSVEIEPEKRPESRLADRDALCVGGVGTVVCGGAEVVIANDVDFGFGNDIGSFDCANRKIADRSWLEQRHQGRSNRCHRRR